MRIIALMNQKGGVGKTTTTVNLGAAMAEIGRRVCLIDLDPQAHLTINYGIDPTPDTVSLYDVLLGDASFLEAVHKIDDHLALVPSSIDLAAAEIELVSVLGRETLLKKKMESAQHDFDVMLLDCPPSLGLLTLNALSVADEVIIPMQPHFLALQGVAKLLETVQLVSKRMNPKLKVGGIVLTMWDAQTKLSNEVVAELNGFIEAAKGKPLPWADAKVYKSKIRRNIKLAESPSFGQTIIAYEPTSNGAADYRALAREVLGIESASAQPAAAPVAEAPKAPEPLATTTEQAEPTIAAVLDAVSKGEEDRSKPVQAEAPAPAKAPRARKPRVTPVAQPTPSTDAPAVSVTISREIDPKKLTAAKVPAPDRGEQTPAEAEAIAS